MKQDILNTNDIYMILQKIFDNQSLDNLPYEEIIISSKKELSNYLLNKLLFFQLEHANYTIDDDINLILETMDELIINNEQKIKFFKPISDCIIKFIAIIKNVEINWVVLDDIRLLKEPVIKYRDGLFTIYTYAKEEPVNITEYFINLVDSLVPTIKFKENTLAPIWEQ